MTENNQHRPTVLTAEVVEAEAIPTELEAVRTQLALVTPELILRERDSEKQQQLFRRRVLLMMMETWLSSSQSFSNDTVLSFHDASALQRGLDAIEACKGRLGIVTEETSPLVRRVVAEKLLNLSREIQGKNV